MILNTLRQIIFLHLKDFYGIHRSGKENVGNNINIDEFNFTHIYEEKILLIGVRNNKSGNIN